MHKLNGFFRGALRSVNQLPKKFTTEEVLNVVNYSTAAGIITYEAIEAYKEHKKEVTSKPSEPVFSLTADKSVYFVEDFFSPPR